MHTKQMIKQLGGNRAAIAKQAGISNATLRNQISKDVTVEELKDGRFVTVRKDATYFGVKKK